MRRVIAVVWLTVALVVEAACGGPLMGDRSKQIQITNATGVTILLDEGTVSSATPANQVRLGPGETRTNAWLAPLSSGDRPRLVQARDENDNVLFCERFTFEELQAIDWRIEVISGRVSC